MTILSVVSNPRPRLEPIPLGAPELVWFCDDVVLLGGLELAWAADKLGWTVLFDSERVLKLSPAATLACWLRGL